MLKAMLESLWATSYLQYGSVTDDYAAETHKAISAYLALYWPPYLERIGDTGLEK
jgi:hypothetical protein